MITCTSTICENTTGLGQITTWLAPNLKCDRRRGKLRSTMKRNGWVLEAGPHRLSNQDAALDNSISEEIFEFRIPIERHSFNSIIDQRRAMYTVRVGEQLRICDLCRMCNYVRQHIKNKVKSRGGHVQCYRIMYAASKERSTWLMTRAAVVRQCITITTIGSNYHGRGRRRHVFMEALRPGICNMEDIAAQILRREAKNVVVTRLPIFHDLVRLGR